VRELRAEVDEMKKVENYGRKRKKREQMVVGEVSGERETGQGAPVRY